MGELHGCCQHIALTDAYADGFAREPHLLGSSLVGMAFPVGGGHQARLFARNVDSGDLAKSEYTHEIMHAIDAELARDRIEIHVAGLHDGVAHREDAVSLGLPVAEYISAAGKAEVSGAEYRLIGGHDAVFQSGHREKWLDGRAGRVGAAQRAVDERLIDVVLQDVVLLGREAPRDRVRLESRRAGEGDDVAGVRIDGDGGAAFARPGVLRGPLQANVDTEDQIRAGDTLAYIE